MKRIAAVCTAVVAVAACGGSAAPISSQPTSTEEVPSTDPNHVADFRRIATQADGGVVAQRMDDIRSIAGCRGVEYLNDMYVSFLYAGDDTVMASILYISAEADARGCTFPTIDLADLTAVREAQAAVPAYAPPATVVPDSDKPVDWSKYPGCKAIVDGWVTDGLDCPTFRVWWQRASEEPDDAAFAKYVFDAASRAGCPIT